MAEPLRKPAPPAPLDERHPDLKARRARFDWAETQWPWIPREPTASHAINVMHIVFPVGERWFIQVAHEALRYVDDPRLRQEVKGFIGQESVHAQRHDEVLVHVLERSGTLVHYRLITDASKLLLWTRRQLTRRLPRPLHRRVVSVEAALVAGVEHNTAVVGQWLLTSEGLDRAGADPMMLDLFRWHGAEEVEHRCVMFDLYEALDGNYPLRAATGVLVPPVLIALIVGGTWLMLLTDPAARRDARPDRLLRNVLSAGRRGTMPKISLPIVAAPHYLRPSHHPSQVCSTEQALDYMRRSPSHLRAGVAPL